MTKIVLISGLLVCFVVASAYAQIGEAFNKLPEVGRDAGDIARDVGNGFFGGGSDRRRYEAVQNSLPPVITRGYAPAQNSLPPVITRGYAPAQNSLPPVITRGYAPAQNSLPPVITRGYAPAQNSLPPVITRG